MSVVQKPMPDTSKLASSRKGDLWMLLLGIFVLGLALLAAYANSFKAPFLLDDLESIKYNQSIQSLATSLAPPSNSGLTVSGRPLRNASFALNRAISGPSPASYRWGNLLIHFSSALLLLGCLRRSFRLPSLAPTLGQHATALACFIAALWALHPMQTESVTYLVQRAESLAGLCFLATFYCFIRSTEKPSKLWTSLCILSCFLGMTAKESMAAAPLFLLLYDRGLVAGTFAKAWSLRKRLYGALALTWLVLAALILSGGGRGSTVGFARIGPFEYLLTQGWGILGYLKNAFIPTGLVFDHGAILEKETGLLIVGFLGCATLLALTVFTLVRKPAAGVIGAWFFLILGPSSSIIPIVTQTLAEHRMYLPLASVVLLAVLVLHRLKPLLVWTLCPALLLASVLSTRLRNEDYRSATAIWEDTAAKVPDNPRAWNNLGIAYEAEGRVDEAIKAYAQAVDLAPQFGQALSNLGWILVQKGLGTADGSSPKNAPDSGLIAKGLESLAKATESEPDNFFFASNYGSALKKLQRFEEALPWLQKAYAMATNKAAHSFNLANTLMELGRYQESLPLFEEAVRLSPDDSDMHASFGILLRRMDRPNDSVVELRKAVALDPNSPRAHSNLGVSLLAAGLNTEAEAELNRAVALNPKLPQARYYLGNLYAAAGRSNEAIEQFELLLQVAPATAELLNNLGVLYARTGKISDALRCVKQALVLDPNHKASRDNLTRLRSLQP